MHALEAVLLLRHYDGYAPAPQRSKQQQGAPSRSPRKSALS
jgi:hypothetical protein